MNCVNRNSKQFKELVKDTGLSPLELEMIIHKMQNERGTDYFPTTEEINSLIQPKSFEGSKKSIELWELLDKETHVFPTIDGANKFANEYKEIFGNDSVKVFQMNNGTFEVKFGKPINNKINLEDVDSNGKPLWIEKAKDYLPKILWIKLYTKYGNRFRQEKKPIPEITEQDKMDFDYYVNFLPSFIKKVQQNPEILQEYKQKFDKGIENFSQDDFNNFEIIAAYNILNNNVKTRKNYFEFNNDVEYVDRKTLDSALARTGNGKIRIANDITVKEFFNYFTGENAYDKEGHILNKISAQKQKVFEELQKQGYTKEFLEQLIKTDEDARKLIYYHELSHLYWEDFKERYYESDFRGERDELLPFGVDMFSPTKIYIETRATIDAIERLKEEKINNLDESNLNFYEGNIKPDDNTIFVFGSNPEGRHGAGAAAIAKNKFGAKYGVGEGLTGNAYALPTKDLRVKKNRALRSIPKERIINSIKKLYQVAIEHPNKQFKVAYRNTNTASLNGYTGLEMINMFKEAGFIPSNIIFSKEWIDTGLLTKNDYINESESSINDSKLFNLIDTIYENSKKSLPSPTTELPTQYAYRYTDVNELRDIIENNGFRKIPNDKEVEGAKKEFTTKSGRTFSIGKVQGNSHGGKSFAAGINWKSKGTTTSGTAQKVIIGIPGSNTKWQVGHHGSYSEATNFNEIKTGEPLWVKFDENGNANIPLDGMVVYTLKEDGTYEPFNMEDLDYDTTQDIKNTQENKEQDTYTKKQNKKVSQLQTLYDSDILKATEIRHIADQVVYWISDFITTVQTTPNSAKSISNLFKQEYKDKDGKDIDFSTMSRADVVRTIGVDNIIELAKRNFDSNENEYDDFDTADKADEIIENWDAIMLLAQDTFLRIENFSITQTKDGKAQEVNDEIKAVDDFNQSNEESTVAEEEGNQQEHWQVEQRCMDIIESMSQLVKRALLQCYKIDKDGNVKQSEFGINERVDVREATNNILRFCQGATNMSQMIAKLRENMAENPWLQQIVERLEDKSGKETDFQSQFYGAFNKYFQPYSVVIKQNNKWVSIPVNIDTAVNEAITQIQTQYKIGESPLFTLNGISKESYKSLIESIDKLIPYYKDINNILNDVNKEEICNIIGYISNLFGYYVTPDIVERGLSINSFKDMYNALYYIRQGIEKHLNDITYDPFDFKSGIKGNLKKFLNPFVSKLNDLKIDAFYSNGNMYQSYTIPSYMTKLMQKFKLKGEDFNTFIQEQYSKYDWFNQDGEWRNVWLEMLSKDEKAREIFDHKVQLNFNGSTYMKDMGDMTYALSLITEYFSVNSSDKQSLVPAWFRVPIMSNKPSSEFIKFYSYRGSFYKESIVKGMMNIFNQELSRIQTVLMRNYNKSDPRYIANFDKNGKQFCFLPELNKYLNGEQKNTELGKLLNDKLKGKLNEKQEAELYELVNKELTNMMQERADKILKTWEENGIIKSSKKIQGLNQNTREKLENFIWNDAFAAMNIMQLTISDIAFYKNTEDLQKRLAQLHAPGIKPNVNATDYNGVTVSDGKERTIYISDLENVVTDVIDNISVIFDRKIANAKTEEERKGYEILKDNLVGKNGAYRKINVTDGQGYSSPTSYRKKALLFGKWSTQAEETYQKIRKGEYHYDDLQTMLQPLKPFVYSQIEKSSNKPNAPLKNLSVPVQNKNSEYLLILADAIMQGEGQSNLLSSIYEVMEESHYDENGKYKTDGIDTIQFASAVKSGLTGVIDINDCINVENGAKIAKDRLLQNIYKYRNKTINVEDKTYTVNKQLNAYNDTFVHTIPFEDYALQQEVPKHFMEHEQLIGSQIRYLIISNLDRINSFGEEAKFKVKDQEYNVDELKKEYEKLNAENIQESIQELTDELKLNSLDKKERNEVLSKILQREILSSPRYGVDMLIACSLDENGDFNIPLGDPIQSKRIEQLLNSIVKNRINKQEIKGGPVVQVSPYGTSQKLHIRFKDKQGNLLQTKDEYKGEKPYEEYLKENQDGVAYFEVFAPISSKKLFSQFADRNGNINIQAIENANPDLLKIIGYRIPTEAKYSMIPMKIVGFLPREAGETIMMPEEITTTTGADYDIDKMYLMIKDLDVRRNKISRKELHNKLFEEMTKDREYTSEQKRKVAESIDLFLDSPYDKKGLTTKIKGMLSLSEYGYNKMLDIYTKATTIVDEYTDGRIGRNNKIFDMMYSILTNEVTTAESFNPGNFDEAKKMGYAMQALRTSDKSYAELMSMSIDEVKDIINNNSNLMFIDTQIQFYKQNNAAGVLIGAFAVNNVCHSIFEGEGNQVDVSTILHYKSFSINEMRFEGNMTLDEVLNRQSQSISKILASLVAASVDAVKDPILNLMNINGQTANYLITLCRMGMPFEDVSLFMSQKCISSLLQEYYTNNLDGFSSFTNSIKNKLQKLMKKNGIDETNSLFEEDITKEELINGIKEENEKTTMKVLNALLGIQKINNAISVFNFAAKYNSIKNAVGPLVIDNIIMQNRAEDYILKDNSNIYTADGKTITLQSIFDSHPILKSFKEAYNIADILLKDLPTKSNSFKSVLNSLEEFHSLKSKIATNRKLLTQLSDFFQSYILIQNNMIDESKLGYYINKFPKEFMKLKSEYPDNKLIQAIQMKTDNNNKSVLYIDVFNLDSTQKAEFSNAWIDLHKQNPKLSIDLFNYNFFRGGIGFNPKTFMALLPVYVKEQIQGYKETFSNIPSVSSKEVVLQFVRNNWRNDKLVPKIDNVVLEKGINNTYNIYSNKTIEQIGNSDFFKTTVTTDKKDKFGNNKKEYKVFQVINAKKECVTVQEISKLGGKNDYVEMSKEPIEKALDETYSTEETTDIQQEQQEEITEPTMEESLDKVLPTEYEQTSLLQKIFGLTKSGTRSLQEANTIIERAKSNNSKRNEAEKKSYLDALRSNTQKRLKTLGIKIDQEKVDKEFEKLC